MRIERSLVEDYAVMSLNLWRGENQTDAQILEIVSQTTAVDAAWEEDQRRRAGYVYAPPAVVKARIRQILTH
jgi:hypothetical protein